MPMFTPAQLFFACLSAMTSLATGLGSKQRAESEQKSKEAQLDAMKGQMLSKKDSQAFIPLIYGETRVGVNQVFLSNINDSKVLNLVGIVGEGEIEGLVTSGGVAQIFLDDKLYNEYGGLVTYEFYTGTSTQDYSTALNTQTNGTQEEWRDPLRYTSYIYLKLQYDQNYFATLPSPTVQVKGLKVYDPRTTTTVWSDNPILCMYDFITRSSRRGGMGITNTRISEDAIIAAANYCDTKGWKCNIAIMEQMSASDIVQKFLDCFRGEFVYSENIFKTLYRDLDSESVAMNITEDDIIENNGISSLKISQPSIFDTPNTIRIKYPNADNKYLVDDYVLSDSQAITADGDMRETTLQLDGVTNRTQVMQLASYYLERARNNKMISFVANSRCIALEPNDIITVTHTIAGWNEKYFRIEQTALSEDGGIVISAIEESSLLYDDTYNSESYTYYDTTLPSPSDSVMGISNVSVSESQYYYGSRTFTRMTILFDKPEETSYPWWDHVDVYTSFDNNTWKYIGTAKSDIQLDPVEEGVTYYVKLQSVNIWGNKEDFSNAYLVQYLVLGKTTAPTTPDPISIVASGDTITILTNEITDPDVEGYEIRLGASWDGGILIGMYRGPTIRLSGMKPGNYTIWLSPRNNRGYYATTKRSGTVTVLYPSNYKNLSVANGWSVNTGTWSWNFDSTGLYSNATNSTYASTVIMKASHSSVVGGFSNLDFSSGVTGWSTYECSASTYNSSGINGVQITATSASGAFYQASTLYPRNQRIDVSFTYKNANNSTAMLRFYGSGATLLGPTKLPNTTVWSTYSTYVTGDWSDTAMQIALMPATGSTGQIIYAANISMTPTTVLSGKWLSPIYDLGDKFKVRVWGDFIYNFIGSNQYWTSVPSSWTWSQVGATSKRWYELTPITQAGQINAKIRYGDSTDNLTSTLGHFQITAPEFYGRYLQVEVEIVDPDIESYIYLHNLNMNAAYWTVDNT